MNPWIAADLQYERVRDLQAIAGRAARSRRRIRRAGAADPGAEVRRRRSSLAHRAARALTGLRPA